MARTHRNRDFVTRAEGDRALPDVSSITFHLEARRLLALVGNRRQGWTLGRALGGGGAGERRSPGASRGTGNEVPSETFEAPFSEEP